MDESVQHSEAPHFRRTASTGRLRSKDIDSLDLVSGSSKCFVPGEFIDTRVRSLIGSLQEPSTGLLFNMRA